jgi:hypothetical protein
MGRDQAKLWRVRLPGRPNSGEFGYQVGQTLASSATESDSSQQNPLHNAPLRKGPCHSIVTQNFSAARSLQKRSKEDRTELASVHAQRC